MKQERVNVKIVRAVRRSKGDERFPLELRITCKGERRYYATRHGATDEEWKVINSADAKGKLRKIKNTIAEIESNAERCCMEITPFSFKQFEYDFFDPKLNLRILNLLLQPISLSCAITTR